MNLTVYKDSEFGRLMVARFCGVVRVETMRPSSAYATKFLHFIYGKNSLGEVLLGGIYEGNNWELRA